MSSGLPEYLVIFIEQVHWNLFAHNFPKYRVSARLGSLCLGRLVRHVGAGHPPSVSAPALGSVGAQRTLIGCRDTSSKVLPDWLLTPSLSLATPVNPETKTKDAKMGTRLKVRTY